ncbi:MAG: alpha/beta fold hydrolase [Archangium sp.]|nr:alpha/beta fold hydrolase [Archangium sp.]
MPVLTDDFRAATGLWSGHAQSLFGVLGRPKVKVFVRRERRLTPDGDFVDVDLLEGQPGAPTVVLLHGLEGSSASGYIQLMLEGLAGLRWNAIALNARSCSGEPNRQAASYSSGDFRDLSWVVSQLPGRVFAVGFSLGASVLLNFLAKDPGAARLGAAVAVSAPFELARGARFLDSGSLIARAYLRRFLPAMKAKALAKSVEHPGRFDVKAIAAASRIRDFDHLVTAPLFGFTSAEDYYARCSAGPQLERIKTRTLLLSSEDDALAPPVLPPGVSRNEALDVLVTKRGGHVGFVEGSVLRPSFWAEARALRWLQDR